MKMDLDREIGPISPDQARRLAKERAAGRSIDLDACAHEPIHVPEAIQPHGALVAFDPRTQRVVVCGGNVAGHLGTAPEALLGRDVRESLSEDFIATALERWNAGDLSPWEPVRLTLSPQSNPPVPTANWVHVSGGLIVVEAEGMPTAHTGPMSTRGLVNCAIGALRQARTLDELSRTTARVIRALSGFERVLVYRFDPDWNGETIAEDRMADWAQSFLGLRSPASDIPAQARDLYTRNLIRFVPDHDYAPAPLLSTPDRREVPLDLSGARLRSVSPVCREYYRNIGVNGSMSASVLKDGKLWGLVIGHHRQPHRVPPDVDEAVLTLVHAFAMRLHQVETEEAQAKRYHQLHTCSRLVGFAAAERTLVEALTSREPTLADLFGASTAALVLGRDIHIVGAPLPREDVAGLTDWIRDNAPDGPLFAVDDLPHRYTAFRTHGKAASGVLAAFLGRDHQDMLLWFRPQEAETIAWAGDPRQPCLPDAQGAMTLPRRNFERWLQVRAGHSVPWRDWETETADRLRQAVGDVMSRHRNELGRLQGKINDIKRLDALERSRLARKEAERANAAKSRFLAAASHDLRQPVQSLLMFLEILDPHVSGDAGREALKHLGRGLDALRDLLGNLLDISRLDAGVELPVIEDFPVSDFIERIGTAYRPVAAAKGLDFHVGHSPAIIRGDRTLLGRIVQNLVENALRYTESGQISIECHQTEGYLRIEVHDTGAGISAEQVGRIWEEFYQVGNPERDRNRGLGLGLSIVQRLSGLLGHPVHARSTPGRGSTFSIEVPLGETLSSQAPATITIETNTARETKGSGRCAVLVDDDAMVLLALQATFEAWGYDVLAAGSADQALELLGEIGKSPDIVVADFRLSDGRRGTEAIIKVRERHGSDVPGILLTGETGPEARIDAATYGFDLIHKPVTPRQLGEAVDRLLASG